MGPPSGARRAILHFDHSRQIVDNRPVTPVPSRALGSPAQGPTGPPDYSNTEYGPIHNTLETEDNRRGKWFVVKRKEAGESGANTTP